MRIGRPIVLAWAAQLFGAAAFAHQPILSDGSGVSLKQAIPRPCLQVSRVVYQGVTAPSPQVDLSIDKNELPSLELQLGAQDIDGFERYRPAKTIVSPELCDLSLAFSVFGGPGGTVFDNRKISQQCCIIGSRSGICEAGSTRR